MLKRVIFISLLVIIVAVGVLLVLHGKDILKNIGGVESTPIEIDGVIVEKSGDMLYVLPDKNAKVDDGQPVVWIE